MPEGTFEDYVSEEKFIYKNVEYVQTIRTYSDKTADISLFRMDKNETTYYLDSKTFMESMEVPGKPKLNFKWTSSDNRWRYQIIDLSGEFKTPSQTFENCLVIKAEQISPGSDDTMYDSYLNFYSKGIGYVGSTSNGQLVAYLDKWTSKLKRS